MMATTQEVTDPCEPGPSSSGMAESSVGTTTLPESDDEMMSNDGDIKDDDEDGDIEAMSGKGEKLTDNDSNDVGNPGKSEDEIKGRKKHCKNCHESFFGFEIFREHLIKAHDIKPWDCLKCGNVFADTSALIRHDLFHEAPFLCDECSTEFAELTKMRKHMIDTHGGLKQMRCNICKVVTFTTKCSLYEHFKEHRGPNPYKCLQPDCGEVFNQLATLVKHMKKIHMGEKIVTKKHKKIKKKLRCTVCLNKYDTLPRLMRHQKSMHPELFRNPSLQTKNHFEDVSGLKHIPEVLQDGRMYKESTLGPETIARIQKPFKCLNCEMAFPRYNMFHKHMLRVHYGIDPGYGQRHDPYKFRFKYDTGTPEVFQPRIPYEDY